MLNTSVLVPILPGRPLLMHLAVHETSIGYMLGQHDESGNKEQAIYYLSKKFIDRESLYLGKNLLCLSVGNTETVLLYVVPHHTIDLLHGSAKALIGELVLSERLARWHLLLTEFDITHVTQKLIRGQAMLII